LNDISRVAIVSDSSICLPDSLTHGLPIYTAPIEMVFHGTIYKDGLDLDTRQFYEMLQSSNELPTTSTPSPYSFLATFQRASQFSESILCLTLASSLSGALSAATSAAEMARSVMPNVPVRVIDSGTAAGAEAMVVLEAARAAMSGLDLEGLVHKVRVRVHLIAFLDTLYYIAKGGRIPRIGAWFGSMLSIKPIIELLPGGQVRILERPRTRIRAMERLVKILAGRFGSQPLHVNVMHACAAEDANELARLIMECGVNCQELFISEFTPIMGAHTGPGLLGLAFLTETE